MQVFEEESPATYTSCNKSQLQAITDIYENLSDEKRYKMTGAEFVHTGFNNELYFSCVLDVGYGYNRRFAGKIGTRGRVDLWVYPESLNQFKGSTYLGMHVIDMDKI